MFYFLADRPNPTRYNHLQPGVADETAQAQMIDQLADVRFVIWDHIGVLDWDTGEAYRSLAEHIWQCFTPVEEVRPFVVLQRNGFC
jgi:hypothetical protein